MRIRSAIGEHVVIALWKLATPDFYRWVANQFGMRKSTVGLVLMKACKAINRILLRKTLGSVHDIVDGFARMGFPNCGGVTDGTHITILASDHLAAECINRKGYFSMVLQALLDHRGFFTDINAGWSGKVHDKRIFWNTGLFRKLQAGTFFLDQKITIGEVEMPIVILGDPAYPLVPWVIKPYTGHLDSSKEWFNNRLSKCRMTVECAFGHNICGGKGESFTQGWTAEAHPLQAEFEQPEIRAIRGVQRRAIRIRDALSQQFEAESH
ncbi:protein ALP1-like [Dermochelys coriacea]|uniref:protein ALP1-like n=1 Tax=Dermochelys coriacea TaxID=27794 RepID=UPI001CA8C27E|nr:protein ALP1-like [Dermochelys coriacea]